MFRTTQKVCRKLEALQACCKVPSAAGKLPPARCHTGEGSLLQPSTTRNSSAEEIFFCGRTQNCFWASVVIRRGTVGEEQGLLLGRNRIPQPVPTRLLHVAEDTLGFSFFALICLAAPPSSRIYLQEAFSLWETAVVPLRLGVMPSEREARIFQRDSTLQEKSPNRVFPRWGQLLSPFIWKHLLHN